MDEKRLQIAIIEDLKDVAISLQNMINSQPDMVCDRLFFNAEDAIFFVPKSNVDIIIVDIGLPRASGIEAITTLIEMCPSILFCMFTVYEDDDKIFKSLQAGAKGYILKGASKEKILDSIRELHQGGSPMSPSIARRIIDIFSEMKLKTEPSRLPLTNKELEILTLLSKGMLYKEIGDMMKITMGTVKQHIHKIYEKLQVSNRTEAINKLIANGS